jgi:hypothetical protein
MRQEHRAAHHVAPSAAVASVAKIWPSSVRDHGSTYPMKIDPPLAGLGRAPGALPVPSSKLAWSSSGPLARFYSAVDT